MCIIMNLIKFVIFSEIIKLELLKNWVNKASKSKYSPVRRHHLW